MGDAHQADFVGKKGAFTIINPYDPDFFIYGFDRNNGIIHVRFCINPLAWVSPYCIHPTPRSAGANALSILDLKKKKKDLVSMK